jgi:hypothetical protein
VSPRIESVIASFVCAVLFLALILLAVLPPPEAFAP